jgi:hypothetical protein
MRNRPFLDRKNALARLLRNTESGALFNEYLAKAALSSSRTPAGPVPNVSASGQRRRSRIPGAAMTATTGVRLR